jgi:hypothetical protein
MHAQVRAKVAADDFADLLEERTGLRKASRDTLERVWRLKSPLLLSSQEVRVSVCPYVRM